MLSLFKMPFPRGSQLDTHGPPPGVVLKREGIQGLDALNCAQKGSGNFKVGGYGLVCQTKGKASHVLI